MRSLIVRNTKNVAVRWIKSLQLLMTTLGLQFTSYKSTVLLYYFLFHFMGFVNILTDKCVNLELYFIMRKNNNFLVYCVLMSYYVVMWRSWLKFTFQNLSNANRGIYFISWNLMLVICYFQKSVKSVFILVQCNTSLSKNYVALQ